jgi:hypothetical protein
MTVQKEYADDYMRFLRQAQQIQEEQTGTRNTQFVSKDIKRYPVKKPAEATSLRYRDELSKIYS